MKHTILLADDSVTIQKVVELTFLDEDVKVVSVGNGSDALAKLEEVRPDLVLADVHMPGADGYEVCAAAGRVLPSVPVLLLVGTFEVFDPVRASDAGATGHMKKPFDSQELLRRVRELLASGKSVAAVSAPAPAAASTFAAAPSFEPPAWEPAPEPAAPSAPAASAPAEEGSSWSFEPVGDAEDLSAATPTLEAAAPAAESWGSFATSRFETPRAAPPEPIEAEPEFEPVSEPEPPSPVAAASIPAAPATAPASAAAGAAQLSLSDSDLERLARRVAELLSDRAVKEVAWEVVPDLAEVLLKARIRELEAAVE